MVVAKFRIVSDSVRSHEEIVSNAFVKLSGKPGYVHSLSLSTVHVSYLHLFIMYSIIINLKETQCRKKIKKIQT